MSSNADRCKPVKEQTKGTKKNTAATIQNIENPILHDAALNATILYVYMYLTRGFLCAPAKSQDVQSGKWNVISFMARK